MVPVERVLLWGFMASGKTAVGAELARRLGWPHVDLDEEIVARAGKPIARIFREEGEAAFRALEARVSGELLSASRRVFSPGGGWVTNPALLESIPGGTFTVWLKVSPETVLERLRIASGGPERPLLSIPDPTSRIRELLAERGALYARATLAVPTDRRSIESVVDEIEAHVRPMISVSEKPTSISDG